MNTIRTILLNDTRTLRLIMALVMSSLLLIMTTGCEDDPSELEEYDPDPVLTAFLFNGQPVDTVMVEWIGTFHGHHDPTQLGISDAEVVLYPVLDADGTAADSSGNALYFHYTGPGGAYVPDVNNYIPQAGVRYALSAVSPDMEMYAETTMPDTFSTTVFQGGNVVNIDPATREVQGARGDTLSRTDEELFFRWSDAEDAGGYLLGIHSTGDPEDIRPLDPEFDPTDEDQVEFWEEVPRFVYTPAPDYQNAVTLAWIYLNWSGPTNVMIQACSEEYYLYMFTSLTFNQGPGSDTNTYTNVQGGLGIFGALTLKEFKITMEVSEIAP
jgi:hypothetical protein